MRRKEGRRFRLEGWVGGRERYRRIQCGRDSFLFYNNYRFHLIVIVNLIIQSTLPKSNLLGLKK